MRTHGNRYSLQVRYLTRHLKQLNPRTRSRNNVAHHYDLDGRLYSLFLDADKQYSCACFETPEMTLDDAQRAKKRHIAAKLLVKGGERMLDIGSGWGGLGLYLAEIAGTDLTGIHRPHRHHAVYRDIDGPFDRIVSVGVFDVGGKFYDTYFQRCAPRARTA